MGALAQALGLPQLVRAKVLPISVSLGWGINVGLGALNNIIRRHERLPLRLTARRPTIVTAPVGGSERR